MVWQHEGTFKYCSIDAVITWKGAGYIPGNGMDWVCLTSTRSHVKFEKCDIFDPIG